MSVDSGNATHPAPAIAPGSEGLDPRRLAEDVARRCEADGHLDPRIPRLAPGFDAPFFQAGLAGYSDAAMRLIARRHGCPLCVTEALLDRTLLAGGRGFAKADLGELEDNVPGGAEDAPLACQIMGSDPAEMAAAALKAVEQGRRGEPAYRRLAYAAAGVFPEPTHLRLPGGEQLGRVGVTDSGSEISNLKLGRSDPGSDDADADLSCEDLIDQINAVGIDDAGERAFDSRDAIDGADPNTRANPARSRSPAAPTSSLRLSVSSPLSFATIDVNLACPVKKVSKKARGGHWLAEPEGAIALLEAMREAVPAEVPCTVKLRRAYDDTPEMTENFSRILAAAMDMGYAWATVHARTVEQKYIGPSRWDLLREIVARERTRTERAGRPPSIIFGSGDIWEAADIFRMVAYTGVHGAAVARGAIGNPWIFRQARDVMAGREPSAPTLAEQRAVMEEHFRLALAVNGGVRRAEVFTGKAMRKFAIRFAAHHPRAEEVRRAFIAVDSLASWHAALGAWYPGDR
jgi:tRNA-dihydrouridine synthase